LAVTGVESTPEETVFQKTTGPWHLKRRQRRRPRSRARPDFSFSDRSDTFTNGGHKAQLSLRLRQHRPGPRQLSASRPEIRLHNSKLVALIEDSTVQGGPLVSKPDFLYGANEEPTGQSDHAPREGKPPEWDHQRTPTGERLDGAQNLLPQSGRRLFATQNPFK
jgi:hypothetical protein